VVGAVVSWATRTGHSVEVTIEGETLKVNGVTSAQQERIINEYLARHAAGPTERSSTAGGARHSDG
jgi:hypothetical protein